MNATQQRLHDALRYLKERGKYVFDQPVPKRAVQPPILTRFKQEMQASRGR